MASANSNDPTGVSRLVIQDSILEILMLGILSSHIHLGTLLNRKKMEPILQRHARCPRRSGIKVGRVH